MSERPVEHEWLALCHAERDHTAWLEDHLSETESEEFRKRLRDWWGSIERLLAFHKKELAESGVTSRNIPICLLSTLCGFAGYLAIGQIPDPIAHTATEGRRKIGPSYRRDVGFAVAYIRAAKQGIPHQGETITIADKAPVKTVCEAFDVKRTAVRNWQRNVPVADLGANKVDSEILTYLMKSAAQRYRVAGRSERAIHRRGRAQLA